MSNTIAVLCCRLTFYNIYYARGRDLHALKNTHPICFVSLYFIHIKCCILYWLLYCTDLQHSDFDKSLFCLIAFDNIPYIDGQRGKQREYKGRKFPTFTCRSRKLDDKWRTTRVVLHLTSTFRDIAC